jgi:hypothetical protein
VRNTCDNARDLQGKDLKAGEWALERILCISSLKAQAVLVLP